MSSEPESTALTISRWGDLEGYKTGWGHAPVLRTFHKVTLQRTFQQITVSWCIHCQQQSCTDLPKGHGYLVAHPAFHTTNGFHHQLMLQKGCGDPLFPQFIFFSSQRKQKDLGKLKPLASGSCPLEFWKSVLCLFSVSRSQLWARLWTPFCVHIIIFLIKMMLELGRHKKQEGLGVWACIT